MSAKGESMRFFAFGRFSDKSLIDYHCNQSKFEKNFKEEAKNLITKLENLKLVPEERQKISTSSGAWFCTVDKHNFFYIALTASTYPERHAFGMIAEIMKDLFQIENYWEAKDSEIQKKLKKKIPDIVTKYDDLPAIDKLAAAQKTVDEITEIGAKATKNLLDNGQQLQQAEVKALELKGKSELFKKQSDEQAKLMYWRNMKMKIIIGLIILGVIGVIVIIIVSKSSSN